MSIVYNITLVMAFESQQEVCLVHVVRHTDVQLLFQKHTLTVTECVYIYIHTHTHTHTGRVSR